MRRTTLAALTAALCTLAGCIVSPADGHVVSDRSQRIYFSGYHPYANAEISIRAWNFTHGRWDEVATGRSASTPIPEAYWDDTLYSWSAGSRTLPSAYWKAGRCGGYRARVSGRTTVGGSTYSMYSMDLAANADGCTTENRNNSDWVRNCSSSESRIRTRDFSDSARGIEVAFNSFPVPDESCTGLVFRYYHPRGEWDQVRASYRTGATSRSLDCYQTSESRDTTYGRCRLSAGSVEQVRSIIEALKYDDATLRFSARDLLCRDGLRASGSRTVSASSYDFYWPRWSGRYDQCSVSEPDPEPDPDPRSRSVTCLCSDATGAATVTLDACIDISGGIEAVTRGASLMCGYAARDLERISGIRTTCGPRCVRRRR